MSHRRERKQLKKEKGETIYVISQYHCNDGKRSWDEYDPVRSVKKVDFDKVMKRIDEDLEKNYIRDKGGWYVHK